MPKVNLQTHIPPTVHQLLAQAGQASNIQRPAEPTGRSGIAKTGGLRLPDKLKPSFSNPDIGPSAGQNNNSTQQVKLAHTQEGIQAGKEFAKALSPKITPKNSGRQENAFKFYAHNSDVQKLLSRIANSSTQRKQSESNSNVIPLISSRDGDSSSSVKSAVTRPSNPVSLRPFQEQKFETRDLAFGRSFDKTA